MNYDFTGKSIKCETWEQMLHLAKLAEEQKAKPNKKWGISEMEFNKGCVWFVLDSKYMTYVCQSVPTSCYDIQTTYTEFITPQLPTETIEVTGCGDCPLHTKLSQHDYQYCSYPNKQQSCQMHVDMFADCPIKKSLLTIKLKNNDTTGN